MSVPCFITGTGLVTCQGVGIEANWQNLLAGRVLHGTGTVPLQRDLTLPRVSQLAIAAAIEALDAGGSPQLNNGRTALVIGTSKGPIEDWIDQLNGNRRPDLSLGLAKVADDVARAVNHSGGPRLTLAGACASGLHALIRARSLIQDGTCDQALVVGAEASTHAIFQANFARLGVLADPAEGCRPFDDRRRGFLLGEAAAAVWLTRHATADSLQIDHGYAVADATHLTGTDRNAATLKHLLERLDAASAELIHTHGTGTPMNDASEFEAIRTICRGVLPTLYSHKHAIGHTQGAAGVISVVLNCEMHRRATALGNSNSSIAAGSEFETSVKVAHEPCSLHLQRSVVIAAGFGGTVAGISLRRVAS